MCADPSRRPSPAVLSTLRLLIKTSASRPVAAGSLAPLRGAALPHIRLSRCKADDRHAIWADYLPPIDGRFCVLSSPCGLSFVTM